MMFDYSNANFNNREVPLFSLDEEDRKIIKHMKAWAAWSFFVRVFLLCSYIIGVILVIAGAIQWSSTLPINEMYLNPPTAAQIASYNAAIVSYKCEVAFGIIFLILFVFSIVVLIILDFKLAKYAKVLQKYDDSMRSGWISRYYWAVAQHKWLFFFFMMRVGFILDCIIISQCRKALKLKQLTPQEEQAKEEAWLNNYTASQNNDRSISYRLNLRKRKDDENKLPGSDPSKN